MTLSEDEPAPTGKTGLPATRSDLSEQELRDKLDNIVPTHGYRMIPMVGLGGSAGSISALQTFFGAMPPMSGMAFVVILHLAPEHESALPQLLARSTKMRVRSAADGDGAIGIKRIKERAIQVARAGVYPETIAADVSEERLRRFFIKEPRGYHVRREVREIVLFAAHDLLKDAPFSRMDLISCRNLLIYLNRDAQKRALDIFHFAMNPHGLLFLGSSE